jgi:hypothetical protein
MTRMRFSFARLTAEANDGLRHAWRVCHVYYSHAQLIADWKGCSAAIAKTAPFFAWALAELRDSAFFRAPESTRK